MPSNLGMLDPNVENAFRKQAAAAGADPTEIESYVKQKKTEAAQGLGNTPPSLNAPSTQAGLGPSPDSSLLSKAGNAGLGFVEGIFAGPSRFGKGLGNALGSLANQGMTEEGQSNVLDAQSRLIQKAKQLRAQGRNDEADTLLKVARESGAVMQGDIGKNLAAAETGKEDVLKGGVGTGALFVPGGNTPLGRIAAGAASGGLSGFGVSKKGDELTNTLGGTLLGGASAGLLEGAGKLLGKLGGTVKGAGEGIRQGIVNPEVPVSPFAAENEALLTKKLQDLGLKGSAEAQREQMPGVFRGLTDKIQQYFKTSDEVIPWANVQDNIEGALGKNINFDESIPAFAKARDKFENQLLSKTGSSEGLTGKALYEFKQNLGEQLGNAFKKLEKGTPLTEKEEVGMSIWRAVDDIMPQGVKDLTRAQSALYEASKGLAKSAKGAGTGLELLGTKIPLPGRVVQGTEDLAGRMLTGTGNVVAAPSGLHLGSGMLGNVAEQTGLSALEGVNQPANQGQQEQAAVNNGSSYNGESQNVNGQFNHTTPLAQTTSMDQTAPSQNIIPQRKTLNEFGATPTQIMTAYVNTTNKVKAEKLLKMYQAEVEYQKQLTPGKGKAVPATVLTHQNLGASGLRALDQVEAILKKDPNVILKNEIPGQFGARAYDSAARRAVEGLLRSRSGAAVPPSEVTSYMRSYLPRPGDSPEAIRSKLDAFRLDLEGEANFGKNQEVSPDYAVSAGAGGGNDEIEPSQEPTEGNDSSIAKLIDRFNQEDLGQYSKDPKVIAAAASTLQRMDAPIDSPAGKKTLDSFFSALKQAIKESDKQLPLNKQREELSSIVNISKMMNSQPAAGGGGLGKYPPRYLYK